MPTQCGADVVDASLSVTPRSFCDRASIDVRRVDLSLEVFSAQERAHLLAEALGLEVEVVGPEGAG